MATSHRHAAVNSANSDQPPNDDIIQTDSAGVHMDTGVDSTSVRDDQRWWQSDQEGISLLATAAGAAGELPYFHNKDEDDASSIHTTHTMSPEYPELILQPNNPPVCVLILALLCTVTVCGRQMMDSRGHPCCLSLVLPSGMSSGC
eukprot:scaffold85287_cov66-Attheya_sp.AAC.1